MGGDETYSMMTVNNVGACMHAQWCPALCESMDCSPPGSSVHGILQAGILEWVAISFSRGSSQSGIELVSPTSSCIGKRVLYH